MNARASRTFLNQLGVLSPFDGIDDTYGGGDVYQPINPPVYNPPAVNSTPPPAWAVGTFYGREGSANIVLTIAPNGAATAVVNGSPSHGRLNGTTLTMGPYQSTVTQFVGGIRTTSGNQVIDYFSQPQQSTPTPTGNPIGSGPGTPATPGSTPTACTMDAKVCPDGSSVGRTGPNCEFAACPEPSPNSAIGSSSSPLSILGMEVSTETAVLVGLGIAAVAAVLIFTGGKE